MTSENSLIFTRRKLVRLLFTTNPRRLEQVAPRGIDPGQGPGRNALRDAEKHGRNGCARSDLDRIQGMAEGLRGNGGKAKAIFACSKQGFWREFDIPAQLLKTNLIVNQRFHLKPLAAVLDGVQHACVVLVDRTKARVFELVNDEMVEKAGLHQRANPARQERRLARL